MTYQATVVRVLIASPGDTVNERKVLREVIEEWNSLHGELGVHLRSVMWERDATPELGDPGQGGQAVINRQLVDSADMLVGIFWTRLGTPTSEAESGTIEEIERVAAAGKPVLLYFSRKPVVLDSVDPAQYELVLKAQERFRNRGLVDEFDSEEDLRRKVTAALTRTVRNNFASPEAADSLDSDELTARVFPAAKARLVASVDRSSKRLVVENRGDATAENVAFEVEVEEGQKKPTIAFADKPIRSLPPGGAIDFPALIGFGMALQWDLISRWEDSSGAHEARQTVTY